MTLKYTLTTLAAILLVAAGFLHGRLTGRWGHSEELAEAVGRLGAVPKQVGDWKGFDQVIDDKQLRVGEIAGYVSRQFVHRAKGEQVRILLICGRPGPVSVHTPDICYQGAGYVMGPKTVLPVDLGTSTRSPEFWGARFSKDTEPEPLHIIWAWSTGGRWQAPDHPRLAFYREHALYKLYVIRQAKTLEGPLVDDVTRGFLKDFLPELQRALAGTPR